MTNIFVFHENGEFIGEFTYGRTGHELIILFGVNLPKLYSYYLGQDTWSKTTGKPISEGYSPWRSVKPQDVPDYIHAQMFLMGYHTSQPK